MIFQKGTFDRETLDRGHLTAKKNNRPDRKRHCRTISYANEKRKRRLRALERCKDNNGPVYRTVDYFMKPNY